MIKPVNRYDLLHLLRCSHQPGAEKDKILRYRPFIELAIIEQEKVVYLEGETEEFYGQRCQAVQAVNDLHVHVGAEEPGENSFTDNY
jgi:hypothetical protein